MPFDPAIAAIRFGAGLSPRHAPPASADALLDELRGPDDLALAYPAIRTAAAQDFVRRFSPAKRAGKDTADDSAIRALKGEITLAALEGFRAAAARWAAAETGFRERLVQFWSDHFSARPRQLRYRAMGPAYLEDAIRPHVAGRFGDMLKAVVTHPFMILYLDQNASVGPDSAFAAKRRKKNGGPGPGLNENLAREVMELHTLGVGGSYAQADVRAFAELLTGLAYSGATGMQFVPDLAEPGAETVLGTAYGGDPAKIGDILAALEALAAHPDTGRHLARKLAVHFVSDTPDAAMVAAMAGAYADTGGDLAATCAAMLSHPAAWDAPGAKLRQPYDLVLAGLRALGLGGEDVMRLPMQALRQATLMPMRLMGQPWLEPKGPNGWPEEAEAWVTPQGLAARIDWAMDAPQRLLRDLPDPRDFAATALGSAADEAVLWAAARAEARSEGIGVVLASPSFNRR